MHLPSEIWGNVCSYLDIDSRLALRKALGTMHDIGPRFRVDKQTMESKLALRSPRIRVSPNHTVLDLAYGAYQLHKKLCNDKEQIMYRLLKVEGESAGENLYTVYTSIGSVYIMNNRTIYRFFYADKNKEICMCLNLRSI